MQCGKAAERIWGRQWKHLPWRSVRRVISNCVLPLSSSSPAAIHRTFSLQSLWSLLRDLPAVELVKRFHNMLSVQVWWKKSYILVKFHVSLWDSYTNYGLILTVILQGCCRNELSMVLKLKSGAGSFFIIIIIGPVKQTMHLFNTKFRGKCKMNPKPKPEIWLVERNVVP